MKPSRRMERILMRLATACLLLVWTSLGVQNSLAQPPGTSIQISGTVRTSTGQGLAGVSVSFTNGQTSSTDSSGNYTAIVPPSFTGTATPSLSGYTFSPPNRSYSNVTAAQSGQDYTATPVGPSSYSISGSVRTSSGQGIPAVSISFSNGGPSASTDSNGNYSATVSAGYSGTATPSRSGYTFSPPSRSYSGVGSNQSAQDYVGTAVVSSYSISGNVHTAAGQSIAGVTISLSNGGPTVFTDSSGNYSATVSSGYSGTATPSLSGYSFSPPSRSYSNVGGNQLGQDFTGTPPTSSYVISGTVRTSAGQGISGVTITFSNGGPGAVTDANGTYTASVSAGYSGIATPTRSGYTFSPSSRSYSNISSTQTGQDYVGTPPVVTYSVSGTVRNQASQGLAGTSITFGNGGPTVVTDSSGNYSATLASGYSGTATPSLSGYTFSPPNRSYSNVNGNQSGQDYAATPITSTYTISGTVRTSAGQAVSGVTITFSNAGPTVVTDFNGSYTANVSSGYSGTATPSLSGYTFTPSVRSYSSLSSSRSGEDYTANTAGTYPLFTLGPIPDGCALPSAATQFTAATTPRIYAWVPVQGNQGDAYYFDWYDPSQNRWQRSSGNMSFTGSGCAWSWIDLPGTDAVNRFGAWRVEFWFSAVLAFSNSFQMAGTGPSAVTITGSVQTSYIVLPGSHGLAGVTISFGNGGPTVATDDNGNFSATVPAGYSGTATPSFPGGYYIFNPPNRSYSNVTSNLSGQDYTATLGSQLSVSPTSLGFTSASGVAPASQTITVTSTGPSLDFNVAVSDSATWLSVSPVQGTTPTSVKVTANPAGLASGTYNGQITVSAGDIRYRPAQLITVTLAVSAVPTTVGVSGTVRTSGGQGIAGVVISFGNGGPTATTDSSGNYSVNVVTGYSGTATPSLNGYSFSPSSRSYTSLISTRSGENYTGTPATAYPIFTTGPIPDNCGQPPSFSQFPSGSTSRIYAWEPVQGNQGDPMRWDWYDPSQNKYSTVTDTLSFTGTGCAWSAINLSSSDASTRIGTWRVEYWQNSGLKNSNTFQLLVSSLAPSITAVTHSATYGSGPVSPGELVALFGTNLGATSVTSLKVGGSGLVDTTLAGTRVLFDGVAAPLLYASANQVGAIVPYGVAAKQTTRVQVEYQGVQSLGVDLHVTDTSPGIFTANQQGTGQGAILNQNFSPNGASNPADKNSVVAIYATGEGQTSPPGVDGNITGTVLRKPVATVTATIGGQAADVLYAGAAPGIVAGVIQVNVRVPTNITGGNSVPVVLKVGNASSPSGVTLAVKQLQANLAFDFNPNPASRSSDGYWHYSLTMRETNGVGLSMTKLVIAGTDVTSSITNYFGTTKVAAGGQISGSFRTPCGGTCTQPSDYPWQITGDDDLGNKGLTFTGVLRLLP